MTSVNLTERRKQATRLEIARAAARLFAQRQPRDVTAEELATAAGVSLRTFFRYCPTKEDAIEPLVAAGGTAWIAAFRAAPPDLPLGEALSRTAVAALTPGTDNRMSEDQRALLRITIDDSCLRRVWQQVNFDCERELAIAIRERLGHGPSDLEVRLWAAATTAAIRVSLEHWACDDSTSVLSPAEIVVHAMTAYTRGLPGYPSDGPP
ncbi:TetR family transcriptional regulator [Micromonospora polyrhachis]|uniref:AcrR family transcriptional regulator n=1 Tax=Micromonospora polyrhachis TaxID=1282883 RepID=A0A7W7SQ37_9ACTN|nr:TetR family transcriptional regulator [Micromonospora polyrhachis]MBB4958885.1 AcrR family transcriptional regulator [Micromonospora polyrhachis]